MAGLKLDSRASATGKLESGKVAIVPLRPDQSELIRRIESKDESERMPPADSNKTLTEAEKATLRKWIKEGAPYDNHWAFTAPVRPALPPVRQKDWPKNPIDRFILAKLESTGLKPSPETDKRTLLRRVSLDLTGLPPTIQELDSFLKDKSPNAYEKVVDRLLASPRYGERMAMDWMDYARYADSNGYQADYERFQWRWRDWVIEAFNKGMPYDQFTVEQLAGDLLPNATMDQKLATGFNRNHRINTEGGVIPEEWRGETVVDRVETTSAVWLGLTAGCARCHDHKYDPLSQKEFYRMYAYFNQVPETGSGEERPVNHPPLMRAPTRAQTTRLKSLSAAIADLDSQIKPRLANNRKASENWVLSSQPSIPTAGLLAQVIFPSDKARAEGDVKYETGRASGAAITNAKAYLDLGGIGDFERDQPFSYALWVNPKNPNGSPLSRMDVGNGYRGWDLFLQEGRPAFHLINQWPANGLKVAAKPAIPMSKWTHLAVTYDGSAKPSGVKIYIDGKSVEHVTENDSLTATSRTAITTKVGRRTTEAFYDGAVDDVSLYSRVLTPEEAKSMASAGVASALLRIPAEKRTAEQRNQLAHLWSLENDPEYKKLDAARTAKASERAKADAEISTVMVMDEVANMRPTYVLQRGVYDKPGARVSPGVPSALPPLPKGAPNNRLGFARWIVSPNNPLTARVTVNRMWERLFGIGIVATSEDFGTRAEFPSHRELLDWLATEFVRLKWSQKAMWKTMVMSATYRQSSHVTPALLKIDPENRLLARGPRFRLPGEVLRDQALAVGGLLVQKIGGPSVRPYQPDGIWDETNVYGNLRNYKHDEGPGLHRRSLYTIWKRTAAPPNMTLFDVPSREACRVRRSRTNTPLQALALLNDVTYLEAAKALGIRVLREGGKTTAGRVAYAFRLVLSRDPSREEARILSVGIAKRLKQYRTNPKAALALLKQGDTPADSRYEPAELAAYTVAASTLLNLDETVTKE